MDEIFSLNISKLIFTAIIFFSYFIISFKTKKWFLTTLAFLILIFPFNLTLQLSYFQEYFKGIVVNYTIPTISILDVFLFFFFLFFLKTKTFFKLNKQEIYIFIFFFLLFTLKAILDANILSTMVIYRLFFYFIIIYLISKVVFLEKIIKKKEYHILQNTLLLSLSIQLFVGFFQFFQGKSLGVFFLGESNILKGFLGSSFIELNEILFLRSYGTFPHPNILACYLFFVLIFLLFFSKHKFKYFFAILSMILIVFTFSRIIILLSIGLIFFLLLKNKNLFSITPGIFLERFLNLGNSYTDRVELIKNSIEIIKNYPFFGIGAGKFVYGIDYYPVYTSGGFLLLQPVHNIYLLILSEYGFFFGLPIVLLILFFLFSSFFKANLLFKYLIFSILIISFFDHYLFTLPQGILMFFFLLIFFFFKKS